MAIGGIGGALLAGLEGYSQARQREQQDQRLRQELAMRQRAFEADMQRQQQEQQAVGGAYAGLAGLGGLAPSMAPQGPPDQLMPPSPAMPRTMSGQGVGGGLAAGGALTDDSNPRARMAADQLIKLGVRPEVAMGAVQYANRNESRLDPNAVNPTSGALGINQWLGPRKAALTSQYGDRPSFEQQVAFTGQELQGPERRTLDALKGASTAKEGYDIWGRDYERPGAAALQKAGVQLAQMQKDPEFRQGVTQVQQSIPPMAQGRLGIVQMRDAIERAMPGADNATKGAALLQLQHMLAPDQKLQLEQAVRQHQEEREDRRTIEQREFQAGQQKERLASEEKRAQERAGAFEAWRDPQGNSHYLRKGEPVPEGWQRDNRRFIGAQGMALQTFIDEFTKENGKPPGSQDIRDWQAQNRMATSEAGSVGARTGTLEVAANAAEAMGPLLIEASEKINRTEYPDINKVILAYEEKTGLPEVIQYGEMLNTMRYLYARALSPTGQARVADLQNFDKIMNAAWTKGQIKAGIEQINKSLAVERQAIQKTREQIATGHRDQKSQPTSPSTSTEAQPTPTTNEPTAEDDQGNKLVYRNGAWVKP